MACFIVRDDQIADIAKSLGQIVANQTLSDVSAANKRLLDGAAMHLRDAASLLTQSSELSKGGAK